MRVRLLAAVWIVGCSGADASTAERDDGPATEAPASSGARAPDGGVPFVTAPSGCASDESPAVAPCVVSDSIGVFVSSTLGSDATGDGTMAAPFASFTRAIPFAAAHKRRVFACAESYREALVGANGVSIFGGLDCSVTPWAVVGGRARVVAPSSPGAQIRHVYAATTWEALDIAVPDANSPSGSSIGMIVAGALALTLQNVRVTAGNGARGADGVNPPPSIAGTAIDGVAGAYDGPCTSTDDACARIQTLIVKPGGSSACGGESGGAGGSSGLYRGVAVGTTTGWSDVVSFGAGSAGGSSSGARGIDGASGTRGALTTNGYIPADGSAGSDGAPGRGGRGGDGAKPLTIPNVGDVRFGILGAGGGAGGCGGRAGTAGGGGGASIALMVIESPITIRASTFESRSGGAGGRGSVGSAPTAGGRAGNTANSRSPAEDGVAGGLAGISGSGGGGPSIAIAYDGALPALDSATSLVVGAEGAGQPSFVQDTRIVPASPPGWKEALSSF